MKWLIVLLILIFFLQYRIWLGDQGYRDLYLIKEELINQKNENKVLLEQNKGLKKQLKGLKNSNESIIERARENLGMIGEKEIYFKLISPYQNNTLNNESKDKEN